MAYNYIKLDLFAIFKWQIEKQGKGLKVLYFISKYPHMMPSFDISLGNKGHTICNAVQYAFMSV